MKVLLKFIVFLAISSSIVACSDDDDEAVPVVVVTPSVHADLYGTWVSNRVAISGFGYIPGTSKVSFHSDGGYRSDITFTASSSGCNYNLFNVGTFTGDAKDISTTHTRGESEITGCTDPAGNSTRDYTVQELSDAGTSLTWEVVGNTLELIHTDGLNRIYVRQ
jgi:hypothetical protein